MDWNNGTIFRVYVVANTAAIINSTISTTVNIDQQLLNGKVFMGVENMVLKPVIAPAGLLAYWEALSYIQLSSINLPPYIDYSSFPDAIARSENTKIFARIPITRVSTALATEIRFGYIQLLNKDSLIYEMLNNSNALSTGKLNIRLLDTTGIPIPDGYINSIIFTLVIYKPNDGYSK